MKRRRRIAPLALDAKPGQDARRRIGQSYKVFGTDKLAAQNCRLELFALNDHSGGLADKRPLGLSQSRRAAEIVGE